jgi:hypothetical protein
MLKYQISRKSAQWEANCSMQTDEHDKANSRFRSFRNALKNSDPNSQCTHCVVSINRLMQYWETIALYYKTDMRHINTLRGQNAEFLKVKAGGTHTLTIVLEIIKDVFIVFVLLSQNRLTSRLNSKAAVTKHCSPTVCISFQSPCFIVLSASQECNLLRMFRVYC